MCVTLCLQDFDDGFRSKFGVNLLGAEDLGLKVQVRVRMVPMLDTVNQLFYTRRKQ